MLTTTTDEALQTIGCNYINDNISSDTFDIRDYVDRLEKSKAGKNKYQNRRDDIRKTIR